MNDELCDECKKLDMDLNGNPNSLDIYVVCNHIQPERLSEKTSKGEAIV